jgi:hypothetical protein
MKLHESNGSGRRPRAVDERTAPPLTFLDLPRLALDHSSADWSTAPTRWRAEGTQGW